MTDVLCHASCVESTAITSMSGGDESSSPLESKESVAPMCEDPCLAVLIPGFVSVMTEMSQCPSVVEDLENASGEADAAIAMVEKNFGFMCVRKDTGEYCIDLFNALETPTEEEYGAGYFSKSCDDPDIVKHLDLGCCMGSMLAFAKEIEATDSEMSAVDTAQLDLAYGKVMECGGSVYPCTAGTFTTEVTIVSNVAIEGVTVEEMQTDMKLRSALKNVLAKWGFCSHESDKVAYAAEKSKAMVITTVTESATGRRLAGGIIVGYNIATSASYGSDGTAEAEVRALNRVPRQRVLVRVSMHSCHIFASET
jgi:hypothetical protein